MTVPDERRAILEDLWNSDGRRLWAYIVSRLHDPHAAEDLLQDIFMKALASNASFQTVQAARAYLFRSAHNAVVDFWKKARTLEPVPAKTADVPASVSGDPEDLQALDGALASLDPADREILALHYDGGLGYREISAAVDLPLGTVLSRAHRALRKLARSMRKKGYAGDAIL
ncbi:MAG: RNA polymerase sigma factor [Planctomycetota bacterium]